MDNLYFREEITENKKRLRLIVVLLFIIILLNSISINLMYDIRKTQENILKTNDEIVQLQKEIKETIEKNTMISNENKEVEKEEKVEKVDILTKAGNKYDIDPKLLEAIERLETGNYTSDVYKSLNNTWGAMDGDSFMSFESTDESTMALARCLRLYYFDEGYDTIEKISKKYCPYNAEHWAEQVSAIYSEL